MKPLYPLLGVALAGCCNLALAATATPVMTGLDNPRGMAFDPNGALYVVEAGRGGSGPCITLRNLPQCYGPTGAISRLWNGRQERVVTGLPSYADPAGSEITGPDDISFLHSGMAYVTVGFGADPALRAGFGEAGRDFGSLLRITPGGQLHRVEDISMLEATRNPAGGPVDTNPYGVLAELHGVMVVDAGANALYRVNDDHKVSTVAVFRSRLDDITDAVPTSVVRGPDGAYYVSELTGAPFIDGSARIYRVVPGQTPTVHAGGFKTIIDLAFAPDGSLYVLQHATGAVFFGGPGQLLRLAPDGSRSVVYAGLNRPTSVAVGPDGTLYVSNRGTSTASGEVLRIDP